LGVEPRLEIVEIDEASFGASPAGPNRIWIDGKPMEEWLDETLGSRTISERSIVKAALIASSDHIDDVTVSALTAALVGRTRGTSGRIEGSEPVCA
jgi:hypothetical protein